MVHTAITTETKRTSKNTSKSVRLNKKQEKLTFIDLFAGIGGFRIGFESIGGECAFLADKRLLSQPAHTSIG